MNEQQRQDVLSHVIHNIAFIPISAELYTEVQNWAQANGSDCGPGTIAEIVDDQLRSFLERVNEEMPSTKEGRSIYWQDRGSGKVVELAHGTTLRTRHYGQWQTANVNNGEIIWNDRVFTSPSQACNAMRGDTSNNAWKEFEVKRPNDTDFRGANRLRR